VKSPLSYWLATLQQISCNGVSLEHRLMSLKSYICMVFLAPTQLETAVAHRSSAQPIKSRYTIYRSWLALFIILPICGFTYHLLASPQAFWGGT